MKRAEITEHTTLEELAKAGIHVHVRCPKEWDPKFDVTFVDERTVCMGHGRSSNFRNAVMLADADLEKELVKDLALTERIRAEEAARYAASEPAFVSSAEEMAAIVAAMGN